MIVKESVKPKKYELVPPDGGWGYVIWIAVIINLIATSAFMGCFGMIFKELFIQLEMGSTSVTLMNGISAMCVALSGFITGPLLKFISMRQLGFIAAVFLNLGSFCTIFVNSKIAFFLSQGVLQSVGIGVIFNISNSIMNDYFLKRRLLSVSLTQSVTAVAALAAPQLIKITLEAYGLRGTLILLAAVNMHTFVAIFLMQPVAWHMKRIEVEYVDNDEMKSLVNDEKGYHNDMNHINSHEKELKNGSSMDKKCEKDLEAELTEENSKSIKTIILEAIDTSLLKSFLLSNAALGMAVCGFSDLTFTLILPQALYSMGWSEDEVAWALSLTSLGDLVTRVMFIFFSGWLLRFESQKIYIAGLFLAVVTRIGMLGSENFTVILTFLTIMGASKCTVLLLVPLVIADAVRPEQFTSAMGIFMLAFGFNNLLLGPIIGAVRDLTDSYATAIYILTSCFAIVIIFWIIEICYKKNKHKRKPKISAPEKR